LSRLEILKKLREKNPTLNHQELENILDIFSESLEKALLENKNIELRGFGTIFVKTIKEKYSARNPKTGEMIYVPKKNKVRFKPSKKLKKIINNEKN
tara:strand:- start:155 stop:445 length:291 start_codon:yes stop_codon:yes gene_type:complete